MKKMITAVMSVVLILLFILSAFTLHGRNYRQTEIDNALQSSMKSAMELMLLEEGGPENEEEWKTMFVQSLAVQIKSDSNLTVTIMEADMEKGILSAEATLTYRHPIGTVGTVSAQETIILEDYVEE